MDWTYDSNGSDKQRHTENRRGSIWESIHLEDREEEDGVKIDSRIIGLSG